MKLYDYYRSTASYRVRIALNIKNISYEKIPVHLVKEGGEQHRPEYLKLNPQGLVPTLDENGHILTQSLAIIEYLDEINPTPALLPTNPFARAQIRSMALTVACDMHPLNNLRVLNRLKDQFKANDEEVMDWYHHWLKLGFDSLEAKLQSLPHKNQVCYGTEVSLADICLIPQVYNAQRFGFSMNNYPIINQINEYCLSLSAFKDAVPLE
ncbi:maleylacetoacetate isomerase [Legionella jordanis]|uniref:Glutathione S-transferase (Maleylacetoacetate isomerase) n=1 Tax=Legionella jordanis TaxID=456 RepID=A0A0W0VFX9_9GAMM|nr:maleylacetoacetate isomerase [Legionella jordanis]KTD19024.1 glutathione S-transferase (maleylacetoacetate isomerase) [Legionella jordanis]RMX05417.1 maleylacetoacetate isomerase [Legionella jordanis]RMX19099.1 maleylacetoacetate isomerase [Legionella jordanis]VEH13126.1 glutathione S-transferase (maleylacetoacetate isomerase) [Legionella jordanis]HAT8714786.1 maleylacetoacetate isomerase [Legionella jordanis]